MKKIHSKWFKGGFIALLAIFGMASCSDDHFDIHTGSNASGTLWENIQQTGKADSFAMILEKTLVNKKQYGTPATITYKELLQSNRQFTVWAPVDGSYNAKAWLDKLANNPDNVDSIQYVEERFVQNHIADFNYNGAYANVEKFLLRNSKYGNFDVPSMTINGVDIDKTIGAIASENGTLYVVNTPIPYISNLREMMAEYPELSALNEYIATQDTMYFVEGASTPGATVNGQVQYIDSVYYESNKMLSGYATNEDSLCAAIYPSNAAWQQALDKISKFYVYHENDKYSFYDEELTKFVVDSVDCDSLSELYTKHAIFNNMYYSLYEQIGFDAENATAESVQNFFSTADSLVSTNYYGSDYYYHAHAPYCRELAENKKPVEASNGYAFITDYFNFKANLSWQYPITVEAEQTYYFTAANGASKALSNANPNGIRRTVSDETRNPYITGTVSGLVYQQFIAQTATSKPIVSYNLPHVLSGTYDVYVVIVPENMTDSANHEPKCNKFSAELKYDFDESGKYQSVITDEKDPFVSDPTKVDTILLFKDFKFPYCYEGLSKSYPMISLSVVMTLADRKTVTPDLNIDCFILKGKDE